jgi:hypothetical protein
MRLRIAPETVSTAIVPTITTISARPCHAVLLEADRIGERAADAASADDAEHRRRADVDLEAVQQERRELGSHLGDHRPPQPLDRRCADGFGGLDRLALDVLDDLVEELAEAADRSDADRQHAGHRTEPEDRDEQEREDDLGDGAEDVEHLARDPGDGAADQVLGREERQRHGEDRGDEGADPRHRDRVPHQPDHLAQSVPREISEHHLEQPVHVGRCLEESRPLELDRDQRPAEEHDEHGREHDPERVARLRGQLDG